MVTRGKKKSPSSVGPTKRPNRVDQAVAKAPKGFWLAARMAQAEVSAVDLAEHLGIKRETVWKWMVGDASPDIDTRHRIAAKLKIKEPELWMKPGFIDLNAAAAHIEDEQVRLALATMLRAYPPSGR